MRIDLWSPWAAALLALSVALVAALLLRLLGRPGVAGLAVPLGLAAGWIVTLGVISASPRQLAERLPLLALAGVVSALLAASIARRPVPLWILAGICAVASGWWMAGAPLAVADLARSAGVVAGVAGAVLLGLMAMRDPALAFAPFLALVAAFAASAVPGPALWLAVIAAAAVLGGWIGGAVATLAARLPLAMMLAALAALPVLTRGVAADWLAAATPYAALLLAPALARRLPAEVLLAIAALVASLPILLGIAWLSGRLG